MSIFMVDVIKRILISRNRLFANNLPICPPPVGATGSVAMTLNCWRGWLDPGHRRPLGAWSEHWDICGTAGPALSGEPFDAALAQLASKGVVVEPRDSE
jgi:hypothetical protein